MCVYACVYLRLTLCFCVPEREENVLKELRVCSLSESEQCGAALGFAAPTQLISSVPTVYKEEMAQPLESHRRRTYKHVSC